MPNPLMRFAMGPMNLSKGRNIDDPDSARPTGQVDPIPERVAGPVFAYRGQETHGVSPTVKGIGRPDEWEEERGVTVYDEPDEDGPEPVPVRIVQDGDQQVIRKTQFSRSYAGLAGDQIRQIVGGDYTERRRVRVKVKNMDAAVVYIGTSQNDANSMSGWPLAQNEVYEHFTHSPLWAAGSVATAQPIAVAEEYEVPMHEVKDWRYSGTN